MGKSGENDPGSGPSSPRARDTQIFLCDASAEAGRVLSGLIGRGYAAVDVPLGLLPNRVHYEIPQVVVCDADAREARRLLEEMLEAAGESIAITLLAEPHGEISKDPELRKLASVVIVRPIDLDTAIDKISALAGTPARGSHRPRIGAPRRAPVLVAAARKPYRSDGEPSPKLASSHPPGARSDTGEDSLWPIELPPNRGPGGAEPARLAYDTNPPPRGIHSTTPPSSGRLSLSPETTAVLEEGSRRVRTFPNQHSPRPIRLMVQSHDSSAEIREEFLAALAEPLGDAEPEEKEPVAEVPTPDLTGDKSLPAQDIATSPGRRPSEPTGTIDIPGVIGTRADSRPIPSSIDDDEEPTNPGGKAPSQHPHTRAGHEAVAPEPMLPQLDDLSDLLLGRSSHPPDPDILVQTERPGAAREDEGSEHPRLSVTVPPPRRGLSRIINPATPLDEVPELDEIPSAPSHSPPQDFNVESRQQEGTRAERQIQRQHAHSPKPDAKGAPWDRPVALYTLARAIQERKSGAIAQQEGAGLRRIVLTDGDISTVTSTLEAETLAHFLTRRGDISEEVLQSLGSLPGFGRHAGAALIARGLLQQEDLWPVLRAHSEWILGHALLSDEETLHEESVPARILEEPAVFGGAAGTEIYLEAVRRVISLEQAFNLLGSLETIVGIGRHEALLTESALEPNEQQVILDAVGKPLSYLKNRRPDLLAVFLGLTYLDVLTIGGRAPEPASAKKEALIARNEKMDEEAFVARVMTRRALVEDGDYFSILGVSRSATCYEIDRAHHELLAEYADHRLTASTVHLQEDLRMLRETIDEAHLVLRDDVRRMRYRAALEALPD